MLSSRNIPQVPITKVAAKFNMIHPFGTNVKSPRNLHNSQPSQPHTSPTIPPIKSPRNHALLSPRSNTAAHLSPRNDAHTSPRNKNIVKPYLAESSQKKPKLISNRAQTLNLVDFNKKNQPQQKETPLSKEKKILLPKLTLTPQRVSTKEQEREDDYLLHNEMKERYILSRRGWDYQKTIQSLGSLEQELRIAKEKKFGTIHGTDFSFSLLNEAFGDNGGETSLALLDEIGDQDGKEEKGEGELFDLSVSTIRGEYFNQTNTTASTRSSRKSAKKEGVMVLQKKKLTVKKKNEVKMLGIKYFDTEKLNIKNYRKVSPREMSCKSVRGNFYYVR